MNAAACVACGDRRAAYVCPRCRSPYCCSACYRSHNDGRCARAHAAEQVEDAMRAAAGSAGGQSREAMEATLRRLHLEDEGAGGRVAASAMMMADDEDENDAGECQDELGLLSPETMEKLEAIAATGDAESLVAVLTDDEHRAMLGAMSRGRLSHLVSAWEPWWRVTRGGGGRGSVAGETPALPLVLQAESQLSSMRLSKTGRALVSVVGETAEGAVGANDDEGAGVPAPQSPMRASSEPPRPPDFDLVPTSKLVRRRRADGDDDEATGGDATDGTDAFFLLRLVEVLHAYCSTLVSFNGSWGDDATETHESVAMLIGLSSWLRAAGGGSAQAGASTREPETLASLCLELSAAARTYADAHGATMEYAGDGARRTGEEPGELQMLGGGGGGEPVALRARGLDEVSMLLRNGHRIGAILALNDARSMLIAWQRQNRRVVHSSGRVALMKVDDRPSWIAGRRQKGADRAATDARVTSSRGSLGNVELSTSRRGGDAAGARGDSSDASDKPPTSREAFQRVADSRRRIEFLICWCNEQDDRAVFDSTALAISAFLQGGDGS